MNKHLTFSPQHSPKAKANMIKAIQQKQNMKSQILSSPIKYLLQNNIQFNIGKEIQRSQQQIQLISILLQQSILFQHLGINIQEKGLRKELCNGILLIYCQNPHIMEIKDNEIYIFLQGQGFEYMQNNFVKEQSKKYKFYQNNQYVMLRKIATNEYFLSLQQYNARNHIKQKKYQLMVDQNTLIGKYSNEIFYKIFMNRILQREKTIVNYMKKIDIFTGLNNSFYQEISQFLLDQHRVIGQKIIQVGRNNKFVYFVRNGELQIKYQTKMNQSQLIINNTHYIQNFKGSSPLVQKIGPNQTFGMDSPSDSFENIQKQIICLTNCSFYKIDKRLLAIIITSFNLQNQQKKRWSQININNQIKGQNYSHQQQLLVKNAQRIRTSQKKIRDIKLKFLTSKKQKNSTPQSFQGNEQQMIQMQQQKTYGPNMRNYSPQQQKRMLKTANGRFRSTTNLMKYSSSLGMLEEENHYNQLRKKILYENNSPKNVVNQIQLSPFDLQTHQTSQFKLRMTNSYSFQQKLMLSKNVRGVSHHIKPISMDRFVPKMQIKVNNNIQYYKVDSDMIGLFLDKKIKNQVIKKAQKVLQLNRNLKTIQTKSLKRLFQTHKHYNLNIISEQQKKNIADDIVQKMTNLKQNPLLLQIESERRKIERNLRLAQSKKPKVVSSNKKIKKEDFNIMIKNNQQ